ncbi:hypothetical protein D5086_032946 [Populus alba]|uniref:Uncharacterized protein n=1 Tax=Populus alba TaxID=43335 RepID=A0ACC4AFJ6_POPAL
MLVLNSISFRGMNYEERNLLVDKSEPADLSYVEAALDDSSDENLKRLLKIGEDLVEKNEDILTYFAERLVDIRKARSSNEFACVVFAWIVVWSEELV